MSVGMVIVSLALSSRLRADPLETLVNRLESVTASDTCVYRLRDASGRGMDCLKVFQPVGDKYAGVYYGVYHVREKDVFRVRLARSTDLTSWEVVTLLDRHGSQPTVWPCENGGYVLAYEKDGPNSCWIRLRYYADLSQLCAATHASEFDIKRTLAQTAEGTPSFDRVELGSDGIEDSQIHLRFHYFKNVDVDQLAVGTLKNFKSWKAAPLEEANAALRRQGWRGNLGDRDLLSWRDTTYFLQEIQRKRGDWSSWRIALCNRDSMPIRVLSMRTHARSNAFANPNVTWVSDSSKQRKLVVTLFLPSEGNAPSEAGTLLYVVNPS